MSVVAPVAPAIPTRLATGAAAAVIGCVGGRNQVLRMAARAPMKLLSPRDTAPLARLVMSSFGGGIVAGDTLRLDLEVAPAATALLTTQASTKIYRSDGRTARQAIDARVESDAMLAVVADPVTCFAAARYEQVQRFELAAGASLFMVDLLTSGRWACGERWAFAHYAATIEVVIDGRPALRDRLLLDPADGPLDSPYRCGRFDCLATVLLVGPRCEPLAQHVLEAVSRLRVERAAEALVSASPVVGGALLRLAGPSAEACVGRVRALCAGIVELLGVDPWGRKW